jgi:energy-coupling factor transport system ATP-binding protein
MNKEIAIGVQDLVFGYRRDRSIIDHLSLQLYQGETAALVGPNGAGKTTLGKLLTGILKPASGQLWLFGEDGCRLPLYRVGQKVGYSFQNPEQQLFTASVEDEIAFGLKYRGASPDHITRTTDALLNLFEIEHLRHTFPLQLSWGEKRRTALAASLALEPEFLVLDEPTTGLDQDRIDTLNQVLDRLRQKGIGMLLISHNERFIRLNAQRVLRLNGGEIVYDSYLYPRSAYQVISDRMSFLLCSYYEPLGLSDRTIAGIRSTAFVVRGRFGRYYEKDQASALYGGIYSRYAEYICSGRSGSGHPGKY